ncbi:MAG: aminopeptidase P family protein [Firmicutes bacterium]|nr:aminopeptidase P family protein [Bacillota bacterium]
MNKLIFKKHRQEFADQMKEYSFALFYSGEAPHKTADQFYQYVPNRNFYYLTGLKNANNILLLLKTESSFLEFMFIEEASDFATKWLGRRLTKDEVSTICDVEVKNIHFLNEFTNFVSQQILSNSRKALTVFPKKVYLDLYRSKPNSRPISLDQSDFFLKNYPEIRIQNANEILDIKRMYKSQEEVALISQAIEYAKKGIEAIFRFTKPKYNEHQLEALFEYTIKSEGSEGLSFNSIIASGKNATILHYEDNFCEIKDGDLVLLDLGALSDTYASDISRTFPANGTFTSRQAKIYEIVLSVNKKTIEYVKPGIFVADLNRYAKDLLTQGLKAIGLIKEDSEIDRYYYHSVSHYLGLDVHDVGTYQEPLKPGIVLTVEPGLYIEEEGLGIRIEDNVLVTEEGHINLSESIIKEMKDIEAFMK